MPKIGDTLARILALVRSHGITLQLAARQNGAIGARPANSSNSSGCGGNEYTSFDSTTSNTTQRAKAMAKMFDSVAGASCETILAIQQDKA